MQLVGCGLLQLSTQCLPELVLLKAALGLCVQGPGVWNWLAESTKGKGRAIPEGLEGWLLVQTLPCYFSCVRESPCYFAGHAVAEEEARKAHQLWLSVEALKYCMRTASGDSPTEPLESAVKAIKASCSDNAFTEALMAALPQESLTRGVYSEEALRARFYTVQKLAKRVAMIDETRNSLYQYFLSYLQSLLLFHPQQMKPPAELSPDDLDTFKLLSYASYCIEHGDLELAAKFVNQLKGESRRVAHDWLTEARMTLETKQIVDILTAYASAVGLGTTQVQ